MITLRAFLITIFAATVMAQAPEPSDQFKKEARSEPSVIKDSVERLKEDVLNKKAQMLLFRQLVRSENIESTFPIVQMTHVNDMGSRYEIVSLVYNLDGERIYSFDRRTARDGLSRETAVYNGPVAPGAHELIVDIIYKGNDSGVFSYINDYKIPVQGRTNFGTDKGQSVSITITGYEKGWALTDFKDRPDLKFKIAGAKFSKDLK